MIAGLGSGRRELVRAQPAAPRRQADTYLACSPTSERLMCEITRPSASPAPLLIRGETGTGKTLLARTIHDLRSPTPRALHVVNCAALHDALIDEALAPLSRMGDETVLLDEIGELSPRGQALLVEQLGAPECAIRGPHLLASTQRDLEHMANAGHFNRALLAQLGAEHVFLAPLRKRRDEIVPLALHFLERALQTISLPSVTVEHALLDCIEQYAWPGNARELQNAMLETLALSNGDTLDVRDLPDRVQRGARTVPAHRAC